jgi:hypothetical protein
VKTLSTDVARNGKCDPGLAHLVDAARTVALTRRRILEEMASALDDDKIDIVIRCARQLTGRMNTQDRD